MKGKNQKNQSKNSQGGKQNHPKPKVHGLHQRPNSQQPKSKPVTSSPSNASTSLSITNPKGNSKLSNLQQQMMAKLEGARFRTINEELYTTTGSDAFSRFQADPSKFHVYHSGYRIQAAQWPCNPLDYIIEWIQSNHPQAVVADMGCGEARLSATLSNTVHSFDLVAANERVTACNMAAVPLPDASVDIVVFCLSLMGTNLNDFLREAHRILRPNGIIKIVEVRSRFEDGKGIKQFLQFLKATQCFQTITQGDNTGKIKGQPASNLLDNKMFFAVECQKIANSGRFNINFELKPCVYKKR